MRREYHFGELASQHQKEYDNAVQKHQGTVDKTITKSKLLGILIVLKLKANNY